MLVEGREGGKVKHKEKKTEEQTLMRTVTNDPKTGPWDTLDIIQRYFTIKGTPRGMEIEAHQVNQRKAGAGVPIF